MMDAVDYSFYRMLSVEENKQAMARYLMVCAAELKRKIPDFNVKAQSIKSIILLSIEHQVESCKFLVGLTYLHGLFGLEKSYGKAYKYLSQYLESGANDDKDEVLLMLARLKYEGLGTEQSFSEVVQLLSRIQDKENPYMNILLAEMHFHGLGVEQDYKKAFSLVSQYASSKIKGSFYMLGLMFAYGYGVTKDESKGIEIILGQAKEDCFLSQFFLGRIYEDGAFGVEKDLDSALQWYGKAEKQGYAAASLKIEHIQKLKNSTKD